MKQLLIVFIAFLSCHNSTNNIEEDYWPYKVIDGYVQVTDIRLLNSFEGGKLGSLKSHTTLLIDRGIGDLYELTFDNSHLTGENKRAIDLLNSISRAEASVKDAYNSETGLVDISYYAPEIKNEIAALNENKKYKRERLRLYIKKEQYRLFKPTDFHFSFMPDSEYEKVYRQRSLKELADSAIASFNRKDFNVIIGGSFKIVNFDSTAIFQFFKNGTYTLTYETNAKSSF